MVTGLLAALAANGCTGKLSTGGNNAPPGGSTPPDAGAPPAPGAVAAFQTSFYPFGVTNCGECHGDTQTPLFAVSDVNLAYANARPFANFLSPPDSLLVRYAGNNHCGVSNCSNNSPGALAAITTWAAAENALQTPPPPPPPPRPLVSELQTLQIITSDLQSQPQSARGSLRYFTLEAWGNTGAEPPRLAADMLRTALFKAINLVSTGPRIVSPTALDGGFIYRIDMRDVKWTNAAWNNMKATDPYLTSATFPAELSAAANQTVRADWFIATLSDSPVDAYLVFLGINSDDPTIDAMNNVDRFADMAIGAPATVRAGQSVSNTEAHNRILSWHATTTLGSGAIGSGHLFKSYNFETDTGTANIFSHPYRPTTDNPAPGSYDFTFADSDSIFTLPNGLFGYYTVDSQGLVANLANSGAGFPGPGFCLQCHDNRTNLIPLLDQVHDAILAAPPNTFPSNLRPLLLAMYDTQAIADKLASAGATFAQAYAQMALPATEGVGMSGESINVVTNNFLVVLEVRMAAAELGVTPMQLISAIAGSPSLSLTLSSLITRDGNGAPTGVIRRDTWEASYVAVRAILFPQLPRPM